MARKVRTERVTLFVGEPIEIEPGVTLPAGRYPAKMEQHGMETLSQGIQWVEPQYRVEFTAEELAAMGRKNQRDLISISIDLPKWVKSGQIDVA